MITKYYSLPNNGLMRWIETDDELGVERLLPSGAWDLDGGLLGFFYEGWEGAEPVDADTTLTLARRITGREDFQLI